MEEKKQIPSISLSENKIVIETKDIPLNVDGSEAVVKVKKLTAGERRDLVKKHASMKIVGTQNQTNIDSIGYQIGLLSKVITEAPFEITEDVISSLPTEVIDYLYAEYESFSETKKKD